MNNNQVNRCDTDYMHMECTVILNLKCWVVCGCTHAHACVCVCVCVCVCIVCACMQGHRSILLIIDRTHCDSCACHVIRCVCVCVCVTDRLWGDYIINNITPDVHRHVTMTFEERNNFKSLTSSRESKYLFSQDGHTGI